MLVDYFNRLASYGPQWWKVSIELICIGLVIYWAVDFLEGTRGERLFQGVIFILIVGFLVLRLIVGRFEGFERLQYLYNGFLIGVLIIAVTAFQPEVRRALMRIGQSHLWNTSPQQLSQTSEELTDALKDLSASRTGAIIVIERRIALGEFIETGVAIDSKVSSALLKTIFYPGSALHDMAVIIRGDRIVAARVQLPLAEAAGLSGVGFGSRHRAAIGITSGSDAACLVVSEETGIISLAENGNLIRNVDVTALKERLTKLFS
jgi:diadenylate cyclase